MAGILQTIGTTQLNNTRDGDSAIVVSRRRPSNRRGNPSVNPRYVELAKLADRNHDPYRNEYQGHFERMIAICKAIGEPIEGNIFFLNNDPPENGPIRDLLDKRRNLFLMGINKSRVLEVGFNAGFSALLLLLSNPDLHYTAIDICEHKYTKPCFDYLREQFGQRVKLVEGNSLDTLPYVLHRNADFDAYIIDGGHGLEVAEADLLSTIAHAKRGSVICVDDTNQPYLRLLVNRFMLDGSVIHVSDQVGFITGIGQMFLIRL